MSGFRMAGQQDAEAGRAPSPPGPCTRNGYTSDVYAREYMEGYTETRARMLAEKAPEPDGARARLVPVLVEALKATTLARPCHSIHCRHYDMADGRPCTVQARRMVDAALRLAQPLPTAPAGTHAAPIRYENNGRTLAERRQIQRENMARFEHDARSGRVCCITDLIGAAEEIHADMRSGQ